MACAGEGCGASGGAEAACRVGRSPAPESSAVRREAPAPRLNDCSCSSAAEAPPGCDGQLALEAAAGIGARGYPVPHMQMQRFRPSSRRKAVTVALSFSQNDL